MQDNHNEILNTNEEENDTGTPENEVNPIADTGIVGVRNAEHSIHILTIIGQVVIMDSERASFVERRLGCSVYL